MSAAAEHTVLVVDDSDDIREMFVARLRQEGFRAEGVARGPAALEAIAAAVPSLVLLDISMPGMSGLEVLAKVRETHGPAQLPIVMVTARTDSEDVVEALELGANDYVTKPIDLPVMLARVRAQLRIREAAAPDPRSADEARTPAEVQAGTTLAGRYLLEARIGSGTFGTVFRAKHAELGHAVAVKVLQGSATASPDSLARFRREGIAACRVRHPNAVQVMDFGVTPGGVAYLVMELLSGYSMDQELAGGRKVALSRTVRTMVPVCEALAAAHRYAIVHRDVKPANIFLHLAGGEEVPKVLDFGIARIVGETAADPRVTLEGFIVGTPVYMAPERFRNQPLDGRSDVYSVGVTLYQMLTGRLPFAADQGDPMAVAMRHLEAAPPPMGGDVPEAVEAVVMNALRKRPEHRPDALRLGQDLARAAGGRQRRGTDAARKKDQK
ncbi:MAG TPA: protein kinase [Vicinamibacteria bacterium]|nr:protein kinase [Vicinamibacteria bacterium]